MTDLQVTVAPPSQQTIVVMPAPVQQVSVTLPAQANVVSASTERVDVQQLGVIGHAGPQGPPGSIDDFDTDQYDRLVLDGGSPNYTNGA